MKQTVVVLDNIAEEGLQVLRDAGVDVEVKLKLKRAFEGKRKFRGQLRGVEGDEIIVGNGDDEILFPFEVIERANVVPEI